MWYEITVHCREGGREGRRERGRRQGGKGREREGGGGVESEERGREGGGGGREGGRDKNFKNECWTYTSEVTTLYTRQHMTT